MNHATLFSEGKIDAGTLRLLENEEINELISIPGDRARFKANLCNWKAELRDVNEHSFNVTANVSNYVFTHNYCKLSMVMYKV